MKKFIGLLILIVTSFFIYKESTMYYKYFRYDPNAIPEIHKTTMLSLVKNDITKHMPIAFSQKDIDSFMKARPKDVDDQIIRVQIHNGKIYVYSTIPSHIKGPNWRKDNMLSAVKKIAPYIKGSADFLISVHDDFKSNLPIFTFARNDNSENNNVVLIPDALSLIQLPELYEEIQKAKPNYEWHKKLNIAFWLGSTTGDPSCYKEAILANTIENMQCHTSGAYRLKLVALSQLHPDLIKANFENYIHLDAEIAKKVKSLLGKAKKMKPKDHLIYKYLLVLDGNSCTYPRLAWQMTSNSVVFKQDSQNVQWFYYLLKPNVHYVPIAKNLDDLVDKIEYAKLHDQEMQEISKNANQFVDNYLTEAAMLEYMRLLIQEYTHHFVQDDFKVMHEDYRVR